MYDQSDESYWANADLSVISEGEPEAEEGEFYNINETPKVIKSLIKKRSQSSSTKRP